MEKTIDVHVGTAELDIATSKVERFIVLLKEANSLADELASRAITLKLDV